jgi:hypothetical protein
MQTSFGRVRAALPLQHPTPMARVSGDPANVGEGQYQDEDHDSRRSEISQKPVHRFTPPPMSSALGSPSTDAHESDDQPYQNYGIESETKPASSRRGEQGRSEIGDDARESLQLLILA